MTEYTAEQIEAERSAAFDAAYAEGLAAAHAEGERDLTVAMERAKAEGCAEELNARLAELRSQGHSPSALAAFADDFVTGFKQGATEFRQRCAAIITSPEAKGRETQAKRLALESDLSAEQALGLLATIPKTAGVSSIAERQAGTVLRGPWA